MIINIKRYFIFFFYDKIIVWVFVKCLLIYDYYVVFRGARLWFIVGMIQK